MRQLIPAAAVLMLALGCGGAGTGQTTPPTPAPEDKKISDMDFETGATSQVTPAAAMDFESGEAGAATEQGSDTAGGQ